MKQNVVLNYVTFGINGPLQEKIQEKFPGILNETITQIDFTSNLTKEEYINKIGEIPGRNINSV